MAEASVIETLIEDLAQGPTEELNPHQTKVNAVDDDEEQRWRQRSCSSLALTEEQRLLAISMPLVYLAGLAVLSESKGKEDRDALFQKYCQQYNEYLTALTAPSLRTLPPVVLSPRLLPTPEQQFIIRKDVSQQAQRMLQELLEKEDQEKEGKTETNQKAKKKQMKKKKSQVTQEKSSPSTKLDEREEKEVKDSLADVLQNRFVHHQANDMVDTSHSDWIQVPKVTRTHRALHNSSSLGQNRYPDDYLDARREENFASPGNTISEAEMPSLSPTPSYSSVAKNLETKKAEPVNHDIDDASISRINEITNAPENGDNMINQKGEKLFPMEGNERVVGLVIKNSEDVAEESNASQSHINRATMIQHLEEKLEQMAKLLEEERRNHQQQMRDMQEHHANSMQELQLRLYISETRLKTYQDALEDHIQSVAENVYQPGLSSPSRR